MSDGPLVLNGRVARRAQITGVERWAVEVIPRLLEMRPDRYRILDPPDGFDSRAGQAWEQFVLPAAAARMRAALVWSPANLAPWLWPRNVVVLHDAAVLRNTSGYSRAYRTWHAGFGTACARRALAVVTVSEFSRRELVNLGGLDPEKVVVIPGGVDSRFHAEVDSERVGERHGLKRPYVLTVGTDDPRKNLGALGPTAQQLRDLGFDLVWAGGGKRHISNGTSVSGMRPLGYVADEDLPGLYAGAKAFVLPSRYEGFGLTCLEAMACGTPVVAANRAALPETCGDAALLVDPDDPSEIAAAVICAATDPGVRVRLRHAGFQRATEATWGAAAARTDALLMQLAER
jgi:glycosyltransferase involved in cell wall biosynthesis